MGISHGKAANSKADTDRYKQIQSDLDKETQRRKTLEAQSKDIQSDLDETSRKLVKSAKSIRESEADLETLNEKVEKLQTERDGLLKKLDTQSHAISALVLALERIRRLPPEALIARPGAPEKTVQSIILLKDIVPVLAKKAQALKDDIAKIETLTGRLNESRAEASATLTAIKNDQADLEKLSARKKDLYEKNAQDLAAQKDRMKKLSDQARTIKDLMDRIAAAAAKSEAAAAKKPAQAPSSPLSLIGGFLAGKTPLPAQGEIKTRFGQPDDFGASSRGLTINAKPGALITAPRAGKIAYAGPFKNYGTLVILEHEKGLHSLIAGFKKIDTVVGQRVSAGEPLGYAYDDAGTDLHPVYYELRDRGRPIDPLR